MKQAQYNQLVSFVRNTARPLPLKKKLQKKPRFVIAVMAHQTKFVRDVMGKTLREKTKVTGYMRKFCQRIVPDAVTEKIVVRL